MALEDRLTDDVVVCRANAETQKNAALIILYNDVGVSYLPTSLNIAISVCNLVRHEFVSLGNSMCIAIYVSLSTKCFQNLDCLSWSLLDQLIILGWICKPIEICWQLAGHLLDKFSVYSSFYYRLHKLLGIPHQLYRFTLWSWWYPSFQNNAYAQGT
jgi:hypothetical protein